VFFANANEGNVPSKEMAALYRPVKLLGMEMQNWRSDFIP
jgi:hypothetical protein